MPSFDIVSEVDNQEIDNALNQARKELTTRFDLKDAQTEIVSEKDKLILTADDATHLKALREIVIGKLSRRGVDLRNIEQDEPAVSSVGHARQELKIKQGLEGNKAKEIIQAIKSQGCKVKASCRTGKFALPERRKTNCKRSFSSYVVATSVSPQTLRTSETETGQFFVTSERCHRDVVFAFCSQTYLSSAFFAVVWLRRCIADTLLPPASSSPSSTKTYPWPCLARASSSPVLTFG